MSYKIRGAAPHLPEIPALFAGTAKEALKKLEAMKSRCGHNGRVVIYANGAVISEEELHLRANDE